MLIAELRFVVFIRAIGNLTEAAFHAQIRKLFMQCFECWLVQRMVDAHDKSAIEPACGVEAAIKAGNFTSRLEMERFAKQLLSMPDIRYCPHGRPVLIEMTQRELEKNFGRI